MNKKFSTLVATLLVVGGMTSASAITSPSANDKQVKAIEEGKAYQLYGGSDQLLVMTNTNGVYKAEFLPATQVTDLNSSLWTISYVSKETSGPDFTLVNKATGCPLSVDLKALTTTPVAVNMGGNVSSWKWYPSVKKEDGFSYNDHQTVKSYFTSDSVVYLTVGANNEVMAAKEDVNKIATIPGQIEIAPFRANGAVLTAKDLNTKLGTDIEGESFKLSATPELKVGTNSTLGNKFTDNTYRAWNQAATTNEANSELHSGFSFWNSVGDYVMLQVIDGKNDDKPCEDTYLMADTTYIPGLYVNNEEGVQFTDTAKASKLTIFGGEDYINNFQPGRNPKSALFKFTYFPTEDSLAIDVLEYNKKGTSETSYEGKNTAWTTVTTDKNSVILNQLTASNELTLGAVVAGQSRNIKFTLGAGTTNRVSKDNGVYVVKNKKGQYLAVPIYNTNLANGTANNWNAAEWVTVVGTEQDVMRMPAYQWVMVKKDSMTVDAKEVSALTVVNREFDKVVNTLQLRKDEGATYLFADLFANDSLMVEAVAADVIADEALGYLNLKDEKLSVMSYKFNYLHAYADDKFMGMMEDSILNVKDNELAFFMDEESDKKGYGYTTPYVAGLKQLTRVIYTPYVKTANGKCYITIDDENRYKLTNDETKAQKFYLKENNFYQPASKDAKQAYYAFINVKSATDSTKMGSADQDLSVILRDQVLEETRTSAFAVVENNTPLYRRFNSLLEGIEDGKDTPVLLQFKEAYVNDFLMDETNENFKREGMNYLGIGAVNIAKAGLSFNVRPFNLGISDANEIKPQYLIYVSDVERAAVDTIPCDAKNHQHMDAEGNPTDDPKKCSHAIPGTDAFNRYKLLVSFADSSDAAGVANDKKLYEFGEYTRVGFVDAVEQDSVIYILGNQFAKVATDKLNMEDVKEYATGDKKIDLRTVCAEDIHHNYTWSFRYIDPAGAAVEDEDARSFLIESNVDPKGNAIEAIAPTAAAWIKNQNNCLVLSDPRTSTFENAKTGGDNALIFNIEMGSEDNMATENESIEATGVSIVATEGAVIVKGAEGKNVVITNVLGQTVANTVVTSSEATIAAPVGVVVVAVEGEAAVKAIVK